MQNFTISVDRNVLNYHANQPMSYAMSGFKGSYLEELDDPFDTTAYNYRKHHHQGYETERRPLPPPYTEVIWHVTVLEVLSVVSSFFVVIVL